MRATWCLHRRPQFGPAGAVRLDRRRLAGRHLREPKAPLDSEDALESAPLLFQRVGPFATYPERVPVRLDLTSAPDVYAFVWTVTSSSSFRDQISGGNETALDPLHSSTRSPVRSASRSY